MIIGECPYCDAGVMNALPDITPSFARIQCDDCNNWYWLYFSRIAPEAYTEKEFNEKYEINESDKSIKLRTDQP